VDKQTDMHRLVLLLKRQNNEIIKDVFIRCRTEYEAKDQAAKGDEVTRKRFHAFVLFLGELYLNLEVRAFLLIRT
jgi:polyadenylate-binding protein-interacting protein 1